VTHELTPHPERCRLRAEALVVAVDYQDVGADVKVAVPDILVTTDPHLLRQILHILVGNAVRHGGHRVAIWASAEGDAVRLVVSDDGPGLPEEVGDRVFERYVDLAELARTTRRSGSGLAVARTLCELIGGHMGYKRDPSWTHFSIRLPRGSKGSTPSRDRVRLQAGVG
jgi:two-component system, OmpR family, sensor histidine kinase MtrB